MTIFTDEEVLALRERCHRKGWRLMHRRNNQYWLMVGRPMSLEQIEMTIGKMPTMNRGVRDIVDQRKAASETHKISVSTRAGGGAA